MNKSTSDELQKTIDYLIKTHGMNAVLQALIDSVPESEEDYLQRLLTDLNCALKNYNDRYLDEDHA